MLFIYNRVLCPRKNPVNNQYVSSKSIPILCFFVEKKSKIYTFFSVGSNEFQAVPTVLKLLDNFGITAWPRLTPDFIFNNNSLTRVIANFLLYKEYAFVEFSATCDIWTLEKIPRCGRKSNTWVSKISRIILLFFKLFLVTVKQNCISFPVFSTTLNILYHKEFILFVK